MAARPPRLEGGPRAPPPPLAHAEEVAAEVALQVVVKGPLAAVGEHDAHQASAALEDRGHLLDHGALAPLLVLGVVDAVAETEVEARRHRPSLAGSARPLPAGCTFPPIHPFFFAALTDRGALDVISPTPPVCYSCP